MNAAIVACALCGANDARLLFRPPHSPGPVVACRCGLIYVNPREDSRALIFSDPQANGYAPGALTSGSLADVQATWEWSILEPKRAEWPALRLNAVDALARKR